MNKIIRSWGMHNLVGHPLMQILQWAGKHRWATKVHNGTLPYE